MINTDYKEFHVWLPLVCNACGRHIAHKGGDWNHYRPEDSCGQWARPRLHEWNAEELEGMGFAMGMHTRSILDNPFSPGGPLHDGATPIGSIQEAKLWHKGWERSQGNLGTIPTPEKIPIVSLDFRDGLDYLEDERES